MFENKTGTRTGPPYLRVDIRSLSGVGRRWVLEETQKKKKGIDDLVVPGKLRISVFSNTDFLRNL